jgi:uncharacterized repeat protein (TIGR01451 family)
LPCIAALAAASWCSEGHAEIVERLSVNQRGDFVLIGNTLAQNCADGVDEPVTGDVGACGTTQDDTGADILWSVSANGSAAAASTAVSPAEASSVAVLRLPEGATVTHAEMVWSAQSGGGDSAAVTLSRSGVFSEALVARATADMSLDDSPFYQSSVDVTALVREHGAGAYQVSGIDAADPVGLESSSYYAGWWLVVFYALESEPVRHLGLYTGFELVVEGTNVAATLGGFAVPAGPTSNAKLGVIGFEGDFSADGDELRFGAAAPLPGAAALDGSDNFFDGSRRGVDGAAFDVAGDLPRTSGVAESLSGVDLHVVDVAASLAPGQTSAELLALTTGDRFVLSGLVLSLETALPDLRLSSQTVVDVDGPPLRPGDQLEYTVEVRNDGTGAALGVTLAEVLPESVVYVPGSLQITSGGGAGVLTDVADTDAGEIERGAGETLQVRLGEGAGAAAGRLGAGESSVVVYRVTLAEQASGVIQAQGQISAQAEAGGSLTTLTDADPSSPELTPTLVTVDACATDVDCALTGGHCDAGQSPRACVECLLDEHCPGLAPTCELAVLQCVCVAAAEETRCDGRDDDCDGVVDEGFAGAECSAGIGACEVPGLTICDAKGSAVCGATAGEPAPESCADGIDDDCDGQTDAEDPDCQNVNGGTGAAGGGNIPAVIGSDGELLAPGGVAPGGVAPGVVQPMPVPLPGSGGRTPATAPVGGTTGSGLGGGGGCGFGLRPAHSGTALGFGLGFAVYFARRRRQVGAR